jgi:hypothetical protein
LFKFGFDLNGSAIDGTKAEEMKWIILAMLTALGVSQTTVALEHGGDNSTTMTNGQTSIPDELRVAQTIVDLLTAEFHERSQHESVQDILRDFLDGDELYTFFDKVSFLVEQKTTTIETHALTELFSATFVKELLHWSGNHQVFLNMMNGIAISNSCAQLIHQALQSSPNLLVEELGKEKWGAYIKSLFYQPDIPLPLLQIMLKVLGSILASWIVFSSMAKGQSLPMSVKEPLSDIFQAGMNEYHSLLSSIWPEIEPSWKSTSPRIDLLSMEKNHQSFWATFGDTQKNGS